MKLSESNQQTIQNFIIEGRKIFFKEEEKTIFTQIRFNPEDTDGTKKWRVIFNSNEFFTSEIFIDIPTRTQSDYYEELGGYKHHIVCDANQILFKENKCMIL